MGKSGNSVSPKLGKSPPIRITRSKNWRAYADALHSPRRPMANRVARTGSSERPSSSDQAPPPSRASSETRPTPKLKSNHPAFTPSGWHVDDQSRRALPAADSPDKRHMRDYPHNQIEPCPDGAIGRPIRSNPTIIRIGRQIMDLFMRRASPPRAKYPQYRPTTIMEISTRPSS